MPEQTVTGAAWIDKRVDMDRIISHAQKLVRDLLRVNLTDPINRGALWIFTAFPRREIQYPLITISQPTMSKGPMGGSDCLVEEGIIALDISIYSKGTLERDELADAVLALEKSKRLDSATSFTLHPRNSRIKTLFASPRATPAIVMLGIRSVSE